MATNNDFNNERIVMALSKFPYFWHVDFDEKDYDIPSNWNEMNQYERAKFVVENSEWSEEDWSDYLTEDYINAFGN